jgi:hypothetical protein
LKKFQILSGKPFTRIVLNVTPENSNCGRIAGSVTTVINNNHKINKRKNGKQR